MSTKKRITDNLWRGDKDWASESVTCSFKLNNREKTYTNECIESCYEDFLDNYGEALHELSEVSIDAGVTFEKGGESMILTVPAKDFRHKYESVEDKVGDKITTTMMGGA